MNKILRFLPNIIAAVIVLQTLAFKFTAHPDSVALFSTLPFFGFPESVLRLGVGVAELITGLMILWPRTEKIGALGIIILMAGALLSHVFFIGFAGPNLPLVFMAAVAGISASFVYRRTS